MFRTKLLSLAAYLLIFFHADAVSPDSTLKEKRSFVIIGAFSLQNNAKRFIDHVHQLDLEAEYAMNPVRKLYYVYSYSSLDTQEALATMKEFREMNEFDDAWVFKGYLENKNEVSWIYPADYVEKGEMATSSNPIRDGVDIVNKRLGEDNMAEETTETTPPNSQAKEDIAMESASQMPTKITESAKEQMTEELVQHEKEAESEAKKFDYMVYINALNARKFKEVKGEVSVYDHERFKKIGDIKTHQLVGINDPNNGSHSVRFVSNIFGYRPNQLVLDLHDPINDSTANTVEVEGDSLVLNLNLERLQAGDVAVMWNVLFFKDAAIMRPESKPQVNDLLSMMKENDKMKIEIHGHTNGNSHGKIIHLNHEDKSFFDITANHHESNGSAKKLSKYRANTIKHFLMDNGIAENRMKITGWGGKRMLYDKHDTQAKKNVRVEIEILED